MNKIPTTPKRYLWIIFITLLMGCGSGATSATPTEIDLNAISTQAAATFVAQMTQTAAPTETPAPTPTRTLAPTLTSFPLVVVDGLRMAYIIKGNLYVQDSGEQPVQLTHSGEDRDPIFSDDGQKIVFFRGKASDPNNVYSVNADGSQEQALVPSGLLAKLNLRYTEFTELSSLGFVPGTHKLLFNTREFKPRGSKPDDVNRFDATPNADFLLVDTDSGEIKMLLKPGQGGSFHVSPSGELAGIIRTGNLDVIRLDGKMLYRSLATIPSIPSDVWPPMIQWTQDSSRLFSEILDPAAGAQGGFLTEPRTLWQYSMDNGATLEIRLSPPLMGNMFSISPNGNWVVYTFSDPLNETKETAPYGIYLGNLRDGTTQFLGGGGLDMSGDYSWSPDSTHFIFDDVQDKMYLGNIHGKIIPLNSWMFSGWIDNSRYLYGTYGGLAMGEIGKQTNAMVIKFPSTWTSKELQHWTHIFVKREVK